DGSEVPVGIACESASSAAADAAGSIYVSGDFNIDQLVWDASFDTDLKKIAAFDRTQISIKKVL
ncbi:head decoration protein, partial [Arthrospira platensis SPKY1]|nr:head decoration protein [Arthrospira platensis SPKY1]